MGEKEESGRVVCRGRVEERREEEKGGEKWMIERKQDVAEGAEVGLQKRAHG